MKRITLFLLAFVFAACTGQSSEPVDSPEEPPVEQEEVSSPEPEASEPEREVLGTWRGSSPYQADRISIYRQDGKLFMHQAFLDGSDMEREVTETAVSDGTRYDWDDPYNEHAVVTASGSLEMRDDDGLIATYRAGG